MTNVELERPGRGSRSHRPPAFTDEALALRFALVHAADLRYVAAAAKWFVYDGKQWQADGHFVRLQLGAQALPQGLGRVQQEKSR